MRRILKKFRVLNRQNNFIDRLERGYFTRRANSGPGTGQFVGKGFEFAKGNCKGLDKEWKKNMVGNLIPWAVAGNF